MRHAWIAMALVACGSPNAAPPSASPSSGSPSAGPAASPDETLTSLPACAEPPEGAPLRLVYARHDGLGYSDASGRATYSSPGGPQLDPITLENIRSILAEEPERRDLPVVPLEDDQIPRARRVRDQLVAALRLDAVVCRMDGLDAHDAAPEDPDPTDLHVREQLARERIRDSPTVADAWLELADVFLAMNRPDDAREVLEQALGEVGEAERAHIRERLDGLEE